MSDLENEAIREKADELDMDLEEDADYLYIAREFLNAPLPKDWREDTYEDPEDGLMYPYYVDPAGESHWDHPLLKEYKKKFQDEKARREKQKKERKGRSPSPARKSRSMSPANKSRSPSPARSPSPSRKSRSPSPVGGRSDRDDLEDSRDDSRNYSHDERRGDRRDDKRRRGRRDDRRDNDDDDRSKVEKDRVCFFSPSYPLVHSHLTNKRSPFPSLCRRRIRLKSWTWRSSMLRSTTTLEKVRVMASDQRKDSFSLMQPSLFAALLVAVSLEEPVILSPTKPSNLDDSDSWSDVKSPVRSPPDSRDRGNKKMKGQYLDDYMEEQDIGGRNSVKASARQLDSRASSTRNLDSRDSTGYDTFTDSVVDEKHERRLERKREQGENCGHEILTCKPRSNVLTQSSFFASQVDVVRIPVATAAAECTETTIVMNLLLLSSPTVLGMTGPRGLVLSRPFTRSPLLRSSTPW
jgi:hypothetical protein